MPKLAGCGDMAIRSADKAPPPPTHSGERSGLLMCIVLRALSPTHMLHLTRLLRPDWVSFLPADMMDVWYTQRKADVAVACVVNPIPHLRFASAVCPVRDHDHHPIFPDADEDM